MKLNIGCGRDYKKGYSNIDLYNVAADEIADAGNLRYSDNSVDLIEARHLIEHLGYISCLYAVAEWFRVLKPRGKLIIETPDIDVLFKKYLKGKSYQKKIDDLILIFGTEEPGNTHKFCFSKQILEKFLTGVGFVDITFIKSKNKKIPSILLRCVKPKNYEKYQIIAKLKKKLVQRKIVKLDSLNTLVLEDLFDFFIENFEKPKKIREFGLKKNSLITKMFLAAAQDKR